MSKANRIVIDLGKNQAPGASPAVYGAESKSRGGLRWVLLAIALLLILFVGGVAGGAYLWWRHYQSTPAYSLALLVDASQRNDTAAVDNLLDTDKVTADFVAQVRQRLSGAVLSRWSDQLDSAISTLTPKLRDTVHEQVLQELHRLTEPAAGKPFFIIALGIGQFADIKQENNVAHVNVTVREDHLELTMQPEAEHWRVTAVKDDRMAQLIADNVMKNLPAGRNGVQDEIRKQVERFLKSGQ